MHKIVWENQIWCVFHSLYSASETVPKLQMPTNKLINLNFKTEYIHSSEAADVFYSFIRHTHYYVGPKHDVPPMQIVYDYD